MSVPPPPPPPPHLHQHQAQQVEIEMDPPPHEQFYQNEKSATLGVNHTDEGKEDKNEKMDKFKDEFLNFDYNAVFEQHPASKLEKYSNWCVKFIYNNSRLICYHAMVFVLGLPWVFLLACVNAVLICSYSWVLSPIAKIVKFILALMSTSSYKLVAILLKPLGKSLHKCIMTYCGHRCRKK